MHACMREGCPETLSRLDSELVTTRSLVLLSVSGAVLLGVRPSSGGVFVLVNRRSGSLGELAAAQLKRALGAVAHGEGTAEGLQDAQARRSVLPRTGVVCQLPTTRLCFDEDVEAVGSPVDAYLERIEQDVADLVPQLDRISQYREAPAPQISPYFAVPLLLAGRSRLYDPRWLWLWRQRQVIASGVTRRLYP